MTASVALRDDGDEFLQFHDQRSTGIGATDSPKILGLSRWGTPLTVYEEKLGLVQPQPPSLPAWLGKKMQATIGELYTIATGQKLRAIGELTLFRHKQHPWFICHGDFRAHGKPKLWVETKHRSFHTSDWGEDGSVNIPPEEWVQVQHEMAVSNADECHVAVLFGNREFCVYPIGRDEGFISELIPKLEAYWFGHVIAKVPPEPIGHYLDDVALRRDFDAASGLMLPATPEQEQLIRLLLMARSNRMAAEKAEELNKQKVIKLLKDAAAEGIEGAFGKITFRKDPDRETPEWELIAGAYAKAIEQARGIDSDNQLRGFLDGLDLAAIRSIHTNRREGSRRFLINERSDE